MRVKRRTAPLPRWTGPALAAALLLVPAAGFAHGGEPHAHPEARGEHDDGPGHVHTARKPGIWGTGDHFEVLVKYEPLHRGEPLSLEIYVADAESNAPVTGAEVSLTLVRDRELLARAEPSELAGKYTAQVELPSAGEYEAVASIGREGHIDLVTLGTLSAAAPQTPAKSRRWLWIGGAAVLLLGLASLLVVARRGKREVADA